MSTRWNLARASAVAAVATTAAVLAALPAAADPAAGKVSEGAHGLKVNMGAGNESVITQLFALNLGDGAKLKVYCVELETSIDPKHPDMVEVAWDKYPNASSPFHTDRKHVNWLLHHSFPAVDPAALGKTLADAGAKLDNGLSQEEAITATQAAIWHFSDGKNLDKGNPTPSDKGAAGDVVALYDYLTGDKNVGIADQPTPALEVSPAELSGEAGKRVGPFKVSTTGEVQELTAKLPDGVKITDKDGKELAKGDVKNGTELYLDVPAGAAEGAGAFELKATAHLDTGRLFIGKEYKEHPTQSLIVAESGDTKLTAGAKANWKTGPATTPSTPVTTTPAPQASPELPDTGASIMLPAVAGVVLVGAGAGALFYQRRRKQQA